MRIAPSILAADFAHLAEDVGRVSQDVELLHVDVMDGHFVPNISLGVPVVASLRKVTDLFLDCHLMIDNPGDMLDAFVDAGADGISVHVELGDTVQLIERIRGRGARVGLVANPDTPFSAVEQFMGQIDTLLVMSVFPGFGGQAFIPEVLETVRAAREFIDRTGVPVEIEIDGGINAETVGSAAAAGADILVAGSAVFGADDPGAAARRLAALAAEARPGA